MEPAAAGLTPDTSGVIRLFRANGVGERIRVDGEANEIVGGLLPLLEVTINGGGNELIGAADGTVDNGGESASLRIESGITETSLENESGGESTTFFTISSIVCSLVGLAGLQVSSCWLLAPGGRPWHFFEVMCEE